MKYPALLWYTGDWLKDPAVSKCAPATRGIYVDILCAMHENDRSGVVTGTIEQLSRIARCSVKEMIAALADLRSTLTAEVTEASNLVTVTNRRMKRESKNRKQNALRQSRFKEKRSGNGVITPIEDENEDVIVPFSSFKRGSPEGETDMDLLNFMSAKLVAMFNRAPGAQLTYTEQQHLLSVIKREDVTLEFAELEAFKATTSYFPQSLESLLSKWAVTLDRAKSAANQPKANGSASSTVFVSDKQREALLRQIGEHKANRDSQFYDPQCTELEKSDLKRKRQKVRELDAVIANGGVHA